MWEQASCGSPHQNVSTIFTTFVVFVVVDVSMCILTNCIVFHGKTAGSQVYDHNECNSPFSGLNLAAVHAKGKWPQPFPMHPGIERKRVRLLCSGI